MAPRSVRALPTHSLLSPCYVIPQRYFRQLHQQVSARNIPSPTPFVPDSKTFLTLIGRNIIQHASKIPTWDLLFSLTSNQLRDAGVEPARTRRYLLWWRDRFRKGVYGVGGDLRHVVDGTAKLRVVEVPYSDPSKALRNSRAGLEPMRKIILDLPQEVSIETLPTSKLRPIEGYKVVGAHTIVGPFITSIKGTGGSMATIRAQEGMWEQRRGVKVDGGERRKVQVRYKRRLEENRKKGT